MPPSEGPGAARRNLPNRTTDRRVAVHGRPASSGGQTRAEPRYLAGHVALWRLPRTGCPALRCRSADGLSAGRAAGTCGMGTVSGRALGRLRRSQAGARLVERHGLPGRGRQHGSDHRAGRRFLSVPRLVPCVPWLVGCLIGAAIAGLGTVTGGCVNVARQFGPAVFAGQFGFLPAYLLAPLVGAVVAPWLLCRFRHREVLTHRLCGYPSADAPDDVPP